MYRSFKNSFVLGAVVATALAATPANAAVTITGTGAGTTLTTSGVSGGSTILDFNGFTGSPAGVVAGLTAKLTLTFLSAVGSVYNFGYTLENNSSSPVTVARISGFGFDVDPSTYSGGTVSGAYNTVGTGNVPNQIGTVDFCAKDGGGGNCAGGGGGGIDLGQTGSGTLALNFSNSPSTIALSNFFVRYQEVSGGISSASGQVTPPSSPVPEPAAWMLMILGFAGIGFAMRKQRYTQTARVRFV